MILVGHQPEYIPYIGFFQKVGRADHFIIVDHVQFARKDFQNRNYIRDQSGRLLLTVPVLTKSRFEQPINEVEIDPRAPWARKHWRSIYLSYKNAPFFKDYADDLQAVYESHWVKLSHLTAELIKLILHWLDIDIPVSLSSELEIREKKTAMLIEMCGKVGADTYISGQGARDYIDLPALGEAGIRHFFCRFEHPVYPQMHGEFLPNLSALDLLFNCGGRANEILRRCIETSHLEAE